MTNQVTYDSETGGRTTLPVNMNGNWQTQGSFSLSTPFKNKHWLIRTYSMLRYSNKNGYTTLNKEEPQKSSVRHLTARERLTLTYRTEQFEVGVRGSVLYNNSYFLSVLSCIAMRFGICVPDMAQMRGMII